MNEEIKVEVIKGMNVVVGFNIDFSAILKGQVITDDLDGKGKVVVDIDGAPYYKNASDLLVEDDSTLDYLKELLIAHFNKPVTLYNENISELKEKKEILLVKAEALKKQIDVMIQRNKDPETKSENREKSIHQTKKALRHVEGSTITINNKIKELNLKIEQINSKMKMELDNFNKKGLNYKTSWRRF